jgi:bifunctional oligoribonuclease and PAP phosphatase NrnA
MELLLFLGKEVVFVSPSMIPEKFQFLDFHNFFQVYEENKDYPCDIFFLLDAHSKERMGKLSSVLDKQNCKTIAVDHHPLTETFADVNVIDDKACSAGSMIFILCKEFGFDLTLEAATGLYCSVICDTGRFSYASTNRKAHKIADDCIKAGVDPDAMYVRLFQKVSLAEFNTFKKAMQRMELYFADRVIIHTILLCDYENAGVAIQDLDYIHEFNKSIENIECVVVLSELSSKQTRLSLRSNGYLDTGSLMRVLGGGGHSKAAGVTLQKPIEEAKKIVLSLLEEQLAQNSNEEYILKLK